MRHTASDSVAKIVLYTTIQKYQTLSSTFDDGVDVESLLIVGSSSNGVLTFEALRLTNGPASLRPKGQCQTLAAFDGRSVKCGSRGSMTTTRLTTSLEDVAHVARLGSQFYRCGHSVRVTSAESQVHFVGLLSGRGDGRMQVAQVGWSRQPRFL